MKVKLEKALRIACDLVAYCNAEGAQEYNIHMHHEGKILYISVSAPISALDQREIDELTKELNLPRQHEVEEYYWKASGELDNTGDLAIVGMMIDGATVEYHSGFLHIHTWRED